MIAKRQRLWFVVFAVLFICAAALLVMKAFRENIIFFYTPSEITQPVLERNGTLRIGGLVETGSVKHGPGNQVEFLLTDGSASLTVRYEGLLPNLFREGQGVVTEGMLADGGKVMNATRILAKHDENYMPREVADKLKATGHWKDQYK